MDFGQEARSSLKTFIPIETFLVRQSRRVDSRDASAGKPCAFQGTKPVCQGNACRAPKLPFENRFTVEDLPS
jgi:hypothetical protein